jgi:hypothetical protein
MMRFFLACALALLSGLAPAAAGPLFDSDAPIDIVIAAPIGELTRKADKSTDPYAGELTHDGAVLPIELSARGRSRRVKTVCAFPPLRVRFTEKPPASSLFKGQKTLKLSTHCRAQKSFERHVLLEYSAYKMYQAMTNASFRVRLANVRYVDTKNGKTAATAIGFFIEDTDDVAARNGLKEQKLPATTFAALEPNAAARAVLFNHMIANHDWSMIAADPGDDCCHNGKLLATGPGAPIVYVPFDFDFSGFVDTPYAIPPDSVPIKTVRQRHFRGKCVFNEETRRSAAEYRAKKGAILAALDATPGLAPAARERAAKFIEPFFKEIADEAAVEKLLKRCD